jgi:hypothetical protein
MCVVDPKIINDTSKPTKPTASKIHPTVTSETPATLAVTAQTRIAPNAMRRSETPIPIFYLRDFAADNTGFEPVEGLIPHEFSKLAHSASLPIILSSPGRIRTYNFTVNSRTLCQLSYKRLLLTFKPPLIAPILGIQRGRSHIPHARMDNSDELWLVPRTGFEPVSFAVRGRCPEPTRPTRQECGFVTSQVHPCSA